MIHEFELWSAPRTDSNQLADLKDAVVAIEADFYLDRLLNRSPAKEPLLSALGGLPFSFQTHVENQINTLLSHDIKPLFIFNGLRVGKDYAPFAQGDAVASQNQVAWDLYNRHEAQEAVDNFGNSGYATPRRYYRILQRVLRDLKVDFQVAPYSALGQLAYLSKHAPEFVQAIAGSSELLLFDVDRVITDFDFVNNEYTFIRRQQCFEELGGIHPDMFTDACMLSGCSLLPPIPMPPRGRMPRVRHVLDMMKGNPIQPGYTLCSSLAEQRDFKELDYLDRFKRSRLAVKHNIVLTTSGKVEPLAADEAPSDLHDLIGQRLPDELYYYLSVGAIGPRVLNQLTSAHIYEQCPADGGESEAYRTLVAEKLNGFRTQNLSLLAWCLHRAYVHRKVELSTWYAPDRQIQIDLSDVPDQRNVVHQWKVPESSYPYKIDSISSAVKALGDSSFVSKTKGNKSRLQTSSELKANTIWRFLRLRGYVDQEHNLTSWGKVLQTMISALPPSSHLEEGIVLATELLRLDVLNSDTLFPSYTGAPMHGTDSDKANTLLLARIACLSKLRHKAIGFTGPLSRHLLGYSTVVDEVRMSLRDLTEVCLVTMLLTGDAAKETPDLTNVSLDLPFLLPNDCALGIAMKHYLDDVSAAVVASEDVPTPDIREQAKAHGPQELFPHVIDFKTDLETGFQLWDAVCIHSMNSLTLY